MFEHSHNNFNSINKYKNNIGIRESPNNTMNYKLLNMLLFGVTQDEYHGAKIRKIHRKSYYYI